MLCMRAYVCCHTQGSFECAMVCPRALCFDDCICVAAPSCGCMAHSRSLCNAVDACMHMQAGQSCLLSEMSCHDDETKMHKHLCCCQLSTPKGMEMILLLLCAREQQHMLCKRMHTATPHHAAALQSHVMLNIISSCFMQECHHHSTPTDEMRAVAATAAVDAISSLPPTHPPSSRRMFRSPPPELLRVPAGQSCCAA